MACLPTFVTSKVCLGDPNEVLLLQSRQWANRKRVKEAREQWTLVALLLQRINFELFLLSLCKRLKCFPLILLPNKESMLLAYPRGTQSGHTP